MSDVTQEELEQALQLVGKVCADRHGTLAEHQAIQHAFGIVVNAARERPKTETNGAAVVPLVGEVVDDA